MSSSRTAVHAVIGALVAIVLSFLPFSTLLGGAVSGFLEGPEGRDGMLVGGLSGAIMFLPIAAVAFVFLGIFGFGFGVGGLPLEGFVLLLLFFGFAAVALFLYTVGLGALGGYLGAYFAREYPERRRKTRETVGFETRARSRPPRASTRSADQPGRRGDRPAHESAGPETDRPATGGDTNSSDRVDR